jgi:ribonuclease T2
LQNGAAVSARGERATDCCRHAAGKAAYFSKFLIVFAALAGLCPARAAPVAPFCGRDRCASEAELSPFKVQAQRGGGTPGNFDFYVLSLSWSSAFCETAAAARARGQCDPGANLGFVVHGLWPQYEHGFPSDCGPAARFPSRVAVESTQGLYPSEGLARYEWRKHGTCSGKSPTDYYADVRRARDAIVIPAAFVAPKDIQTWTPVDIVRAFIAANSRLRPGMLGVACARGALQEVRICFSKDLRNFQACPEVARQGCRAREVSVPPVL